MRRDAGGEAPVASQLPGPCRASWPPGGAEGAVGGRWGTWRVWCAPVPGGDPGGPGRVAGQGDAGGSWGVVVGTMNVLICVLVCYC